MQKATATLSSSTVQTLVSPQGKDDNLARALYSNQYHMTLMSLYQLYKLLRIETPELVKHTRFDEAITQLGTLPSPLQKALLKYPTTSFWIDVAWDLVNRRSHILFPEMHMSMHLQDFWRFVLAAALQAGNQEMYCTLRTNSSGRLVLPGTHRYLQFQGVEPLQQVEIHLQGGDIQVSHPGSKVPIQKEWQQIPLVASCVEINTVDDDARLPGRTHAIYEQLREDTTQAWQKVLTEAWSLIAKAAPLLLEEIQLGVQIIVPVCSTEDVHLSASYHEAPGLITMSWTPENVMIAEALVHEYHHQKLNALMNIDPLIEDPEELAIYYSPWRKDPRPLRGLLHAAFTFQAIVEFYNNLMDSHLAHLDEEQQLRRIYQGSCQVAYALEALQEQGHFTRLGMSLLEGLRKNLEQQQDRMPDLSEKAKQEVDETLASHRSEWDRQYGSLFQQDLTLLEDITPSLPDLPTLDEKHTRLQKRVLQWLELPLQFDLLTALNDVVPFDPLVDKVEIAYQNQGIAEIASIAQEATPGTSLLLDLLGGHIAYIIGDYERAAHLYKACLQHERTNILLWQYYAFALRNLRQWQDSTAILFNVSRLSNFQTFSGMSERNTHEDFVSRVLEILRGETTFVEPVSTPAVSAVQPEALEASLDNALAPFLPNSTLKRFFTFAPTGDQLPSFLAVVYGLKPAMDLWITPENWNAFHVLVTELGLAYYVDTYFDPYSDQLQSIASDNFTTTRAALSRTFNTNTQAHVFLARTSEALYKAVNAGWYPLVIDGYVVNKHRLDHNTFGEALGYPLCCQEFFLKRNNWHDDNTFYAAYQNTAHLPDKFSNGFLRHTMFSLAAYIPCSMSCATTIAYAKKLHGMIAQEFPAYAQEIERHLASPILCLSELRVYRFTGEVFSPTGVEYSQVERIYTSTESDSVYDQLQQGNRCVLDGPIVYIYKGQHLIATHVARGDRHGPEMPFLVQWKP